MPKKSKPESAPSADETQVPQEASALEAKASPESAGKNGPKNSGSQKAPRGIPLKLVRFLSDFSGPVGIKAGPQLKACSNEEPTHRHTLTLYPEKNLVKITWYPKRQPSRSFLVSFARCEYASPFEGTEKPAMPKD